MGLTITPEIELLHGKSEELRHCILTLLEENCASIDALSPDKYANRDEWLNSPELRSFSALLDLEESVGGTVEFDTCVLKQVVCDTSFLESAVKMVLISGPAGFGKTSFCKWQALTSAELLLTETGNVLPVFVPLHKFAQDVSTNVDEAFFDSPELIQLLEDKNRTTTIRLFLDGLDEVPDPSRQAHIVDLARSAMDKVANCQVVITARDHVVGPWLEGVVRLRVQPLDDVQQRTLAVNWLGSQEAADTFFLQMPPTSPLRPLLGVPLLATLILAVFKKQQHLPPNRTALYSLFIELLCGGWDTAKGIRRQDRFGVHDKRLVLAHLAGKSHLGKQRDASLADFRMAVKHSLSLLAGHSDDLLAEILQDGLLLNTGTGLRFSHLSFQEYLAAEFLVMGDPNRDRVKLALKQFYSGDDWWKEVLSFYVTSTSSPGDMEDWLVKRAKDSKSSVGSAAVLSGEFDERLAFLRGVLRDAFPSYSSKYPTDGIVAETVRRGTSLITERRTLTGARVDD